LERVLVRDRLSVRAALALAGIALGVAATGLCGCGRYGPLELPPGPAAAPVPSAQLSSSDAGVPGRLPDDPLKTGFDAQGNPVATPGQKKQFILDPLLQ
jgi:predicted small lipoprotein YifL